MRRLHRGDVITPYGGAVFSVPIEHIELVLDGAVSWGAEFGVVGDVGVIHIDYCGRSRPDLVQHFFVIVVADYARDAFVGSGVIDDVCLRTVNDLEVSFVFNVALLKISVEREGSNCRITSNGLCITRCADG